MKTENFIILLCICLMLPSLAQSQIKFGLRGGLNSTQINTDKLVILNEDDVEEFRLEVERARFGYHFGIFLQAQSDFLFIQPEVWFRSNSVDYTIEDIQNPDADKVLTERYQYIDIPVSLGLKFGPLRFGCGPVGHIFINSTSELLDTDPVEGYRQQFEEMTVGYITGVGLDIWNFHLDVNYQGSFNKFGDHFVFFGEEYSFSKSPSRLLATVGISF